ncbi:MAG: IS110 family transposase [Planctomycetota bacterium]|nr:MAG: IS110 family transposase [Planctomycetota bacterium]
MASLNVFVGLDYHQDQVQVCVVDESGKVLCNRSVINDARKIYRAAERCGSVQAAALEACCGASNLAQELVELGWSVSLAHPGFVARMKQNPDKTDYADARLLADLLRVGYLPKVWLAPERLRRLRRLVRYRQQLVDQRRDVKLRIRALLRENRLRGPVGVSAWSKRWLAWVHEEAELIEEDRWMMNQHVEMLDYYTQKIVAVEVQLKQVGQDDAVVQKLLSLAGVGWVTALTLRAEIGQFDRFQTGKQLARYCGVTPRNASSGQRQADAGLIRAGNPQVRRVLIELSHRLINRIQGRWMALAAKLMRAGKKTNIVVAAVANRWVRWLHHQMQPETLAA